MLVASYKTFKYHRSLISSVDKFITKEFKSRFDYSFIISYGNFNDLKSNIIEKKAGLICLENGYENAFSKFNATTRKHIRRFDKIEELKLKFKVDDYDSFYSFYKKCENSREWFPIPKSELFNSKIFYVSYNDKPISGITAYEDNEHIRLGRIFSSVRLSSHPKRNLIYGVSSKRLVYEFCKYAANNGFSKLDIGGIALNSNDKSGIKNFKMNFNPQVVPVKIGRYFNLNNKQNFKNTIYKDKLDLT